MAFEGRSLKRLSSGKIRRVLFVKFGSILKLTAKRQDAILREGGPDDLESDGQPIDESAGNRERRETRQVTRLDEPRADTFLLGALRRIFIEWLVGPVGQAGGRNHAG